MSDDETESVPLSLIYELADYHKSVARHAYDQNQTGLGDKHHSWARQLNEATDRDWNEIGDTDE
jgi:hypothetical protein